MHFLLYLRDVILAANMDMTTRYGTLSYDVAGDLLQGTRYERAAPKSLARYKYKTRMAVEETIGKYQGNQAEKTVLTPWVYGDELWD